MSDSSDAFAFVMFRLTLKQNVFFSSIAVILCVWVNFNQIAMLYLHFYLFNLFLFIVLY